MKFKEICTLKFARACLFAAMILAFISPSNAQVTAQMIQFNSPRVDLKFYLPLRSGINSEHPLKFELPKLNLILNLVENYIQYLSKLQKIAPATSIEMVYSPGKAMDTWADNQNLIRLKELGLNHALDLINSHLKEKSTTDASYLLDNADTLFKIPDQFTRKECLISEKLKASCLSNNIKSLEPDESFCVLPNENVLVTRPFLRANRMFILGEDSENTNKMILGQGKNWYSNLTPSQDSKFVAFADGGIPMVMDIASGSVSKVFDNEDVLLLQMKWSPKNDYLAGMVLEKSTQDRIAFVYSATDKKRLTFIDNEKLESNHIFSYPYWAPNGEKLIFTTGKKFHLIDVKQQKLFPSVQHLANPISELTWSFDSNAFAVVEIIGQSRDKYIFDDLDLRKSILHRFNLTPGGVAVEDHAQRFESRNTIKLVSFWTLDRVLFLEGRLVSKKLNLPIWDLSQNFTAKLTATPGIAAAKENKSKTDSVDLPMKYLYVYKTLDGKYKNVYDAGFSHINHVYSDEVQNYWFIGLRKPDSIPQPQNTHNFRHSPYPFVEDNMVLFSDRTAPKAYSLLKFLQDYNIRTIFINPETENLFFLSNFCGPMNLWTGNLQDIVNGLVSDR